MEHEISRDVVWSIEYSGSQGVNLYSIAYPNQSGFGNYAVGDPCSSNGSDCNSAPNPNYSFAVGYRGNQRFSIYHGLNNRVLLRNFRNWGVDLPLNYTWSHAIDNLSNTFFEAGTANQYGNSNITINNGDFVYGLLDPFHPNRDRAMRNSMSASE